MLLIGGVYSAILIKMFDVGCVLGPRTTRVKRALKEEEAEEDDAGDKDDDDEDDEDDAEDAMERERERETESKRETERERDKPSAMFYTDSKASWTSFAFGPTSPKGGSSSS